MKRIFILLYLQSFFVYRETFSLDISAFITPCKANDPNLNECVKDAAHKLVPLVSKGVSQWNVPSVDPLRTPEMIFTQNSGNNDLVITYTDIVQKGFSAIQVENADLDLQHGVMNFKLSYPFISFTADYVAKGHFLGFEVDGNGKTNISVWNAFSSFVLKYHVISDHIREDSIIIGFSFDKIFLDFTNLKVNNDQELSESATQFINDNSKEIIEAFKPDLEKFYANISREFLQVLFDAVPYSILFPKD